MGIYDELEFGRYTNDGLDGRECIHCSDTAWSHEYYAEQFEHPFIANNLELLEWKSKQWEESHPGKVLA